MVTSLLVLLLATLPGCTPEKARALRAAVEQFKVESLEAINRIEEMTEKEVSAPPVSEEEQTAGFVDRILSTSRPLTPEIVDLAIDPFTVRATGGTTARKQFVADMRGQYSAFAAIFAELEQANFTGRKTVKDSEVHAKVLTAQMAVFAKVTAENPPVLLQWRSALVQEMSAVKADTTLGDAEKRIRLAQLKERWQAVRQQEEELQRTTVEQCLKAATLGHEVQKLIAEYDRLSVGDLNSLTAAALRLAGEASGKDFSALSSKAGALFSRLQQDPEFSTAVQAALDAVQRRDSAGGGPSPSSGGDTR